MFRLFFNAFLQRLGCLEFWSVSSLDLDLLLGARMDSGSSGPFYHGEFTESRYINLLPLGQLFRDCAEDQINSFSRVFLGSLPLLGQLFDKFGLGHVPSLFSFDRAGLSGVVTL